MADGVISIDFGNQGPIDVTFQDLAEGPHKGRIEDAIQETDGKKTYKLVVLDIEDDSPTKGVTGRFSIGSDFTTNHNKKGADRFFNMNVAMMANLLASIGIPTDKIKGKKDIPMASLIGKECYFIATNPVEEFDDTGKRNFQERKFCTPTEYNALKKSKATVRARSSSNGTVAHQKVEASSQPAAQPQAQPTPTPAAAAPDLGDLFNS